MGTTKVDLVEDLLRKPASAARDGLVQRALTGEFHDFDSPHDLPKVEAARALERAGFLDLVEKVKAGAYDDEPATVEQKRELLGLLTQSFSGKNRAARRPKR
jgi:hypothetical protein